MLQSRIPRLCSILVVGSSMAISGLIMQRITNNRFVSPTTAGTMEWCRFGVMIAILYLPGASPIWRVGAAFVISLIGTSCFLAVIARVRHQNVILVPLIGIMLGGVVNAGAVFMPTSLILYRIWRHGCRGVSPLSLRAIMNCSMPASR